MISVDAVNDIVIHEINSSFSDETRKLSVFPNDREITIKRGGNPTGFAFDLRNNDGTKEKTFSYFMEAESYSRCGSNFRKDGKAKAEEYLIGSVGTITLGSGDRLPYPIMVRFSVLEEASICPIIYRLVIEEEKDDEIVGNYSEAQILVHIK